MIRRVLIANRGEIAVRIVRACRDAGITSIAVYADPDRDAVHVRAADEAYALTGDTPATTYLDMAKVLAAAAASNADAVHPGYGFLSENADFAHQVEDAGLIWIGPPPHAIRLLGDKVSARRVARRVGAPLVAGTSGPVSGAAEAVAFAAEHGLPVAIKAAFGGGGRGLRVARTLDEIPTLYDSAVREAQIAFGRGECFVERYLDRPRHVETQCLADRHGSVVVVSTRDCSLQRRHQKLVEEAPAPYLTAQQNDQLYAASKAILAEAGYVGAGTVEFLLGEDGTISFLEVNTRLQVEHPVSEEVTGIDLVQEQIRIAAGEAIGYTDPPVRGHAMEFRINSEDPGRGFLPIPGRVEVFRPPSGPGVRVDAGVEDGSTVGAAWDSLLAKLIVTGSSREQVLRRAARALSEFEVRGVTTVLPFHRAVVLDPAFASEPFTVHTRWIETGFAGVIPAAPAEPAPEDATTAGERRTVVVEVNGRRVAVSLPPGFGVTGDVMTGRRPSRRTPKAPVPASDGTLTAPMQGTVVQVCVAEGDHVAAGDPVVVLEAMKMEQTLTAHRTGVVTGLAATAGCAVAAGAVLCTIASPVPSEQRQ